MTSTPRTAPTLRPWPSFPEGWSDTRATLHMWTQIVGKVRLALSPWQNHYWHSALYVSTRGLTTSPIPYADGNFEIELDLVEHRLRMESTWGAHESIPLRAISVADFYAEAMAALRALGVEVSIWPRPVEVPDPIRFDQDRVHAAYDPSAAQAMWRILVDTDRVFKVFRGRFLGKSSPVHFFWGAFDLAVTRFSGRRALMWDGPVVNVHPHVMHVSYSHEVSSAGLWFGDGSVPPLFYSYAVPTPAGFSEAAVRPEGAAWSTEAGEFVLPYDVVQSNPNPTAALEAFLESTYAAAADLGNWDRPLLEQMPACLCDVEGRPYPRKR